ncbi:MAG: flagellar basal body P-ring formation chaperone FlgA, partial [Opitutales bacterium]
MKKPTCGNFSTLAFATILCGGAFPLWAGVEDLLGPLDFSPYENRVVAVSSPQVVSSLPTAPRRVVPMASSAITKEDLETQLGMVLAKRFGLRGEFKVEISQWNSHQVSGGWSLELLQVSPDRPSSSATVRFTINTHKGKSRPIQMPIRCRHLNEIYVAGRALNRGDRLSARVLETRLVDVLRQNVRIISADVDLDGYEFTGSASPGAPIRWNHVNSIPAVRKGQVVDVYASGKNLYITLKGIAMQDGGNGEYITVRNM